VQDSLEQLLTIHVRPHPDHHTVLVFEDGEELVDVRDPLPIS
jgi:hypothetical protein